MLVTFNSLSWLENLIGFSKWIMRLKGSSQPQQANLQRKSFMNADPFSFIRCLRDSRSVCAMIWMKTMFSSLESNWLFSTKLWKCVKEKQAFFRRYLTVYFLIIHIYKLLRRGFQICQVLIAKTLWTRWLWWLLFWIHYILLDIIREKIRGKEILGRRRIDRKVSYLTKFLSYFRELWRWG